MKRLALLMRLNPEPADTFVSMDKPDTRDRLVVLIAIEPFSYRETIGYVIQALRAELDVEIVDPDALCSEVKRLDADLVLCSQPNPEHNGRPIWVEFHPYAEPARIRWNGHRLDFGRSVELDDLLTLIDDLARRIEEAG